MLRTLALIAALIVAQAGLAEPAKAAAYDLLFREGTLESVGDGDVLTYAREVTNEIEPETATRDTGLISLSVARGEVPMATLRFEQGDRYRGLGSFPASVGNPMIMYFYESVVRDMAETAGGSPFYIRNRVKEALVQPVEIATGETEFDGKRIETQTVTLHPFTDDPNRARMQGFGDLEMRVTMSDAVPGWYLTLVAEASAYRSEVRFDGTVAE